MDLGHDISGAMLHGVDYLGELSFGRRRYTRELDGADIVVIGIPFDSGTVNRPGARFGPRAIREQTSLVSCYPWGVHPWDFNPFERHNVIDYSDIAFTTAFPKFLASGHYQKISPSRNSLSNAMNVGHPSNLARLVSVYGGQMDETGKINQLPDLVAMRRDIFSSSITDERTVAGIRDFWNQFQLLLEPHGAVAWQGLQDWTAQEPLGNSPAVIVETANPAKFPVEVQKVVGWEPDVPANMLASLRLPETFERMDADYARFKAYLLQQHP